MESVSLLTKLGATTISRALESGTIVISIDKRKMCSDCFSKAMENGSMNPRGTSRHSKIYVTTSSMSYVFTIILDRCEECNELSFSVFSTDKQCITQILQGWSSMFTSCKEMFKPILNKMRILPGSSGNLSVGTVFCQLDSNSLNMLDTLCTMFWEVMSQCLDNPSVINAAKPMCFFKEKQEIAGLFCKTITYLVSKTTIVEELTYLLVLLRFIILDYIGPKISPNVYIIDADIDALENKY